MLRLTPCARTAQNDHTKNALSTPLPDEWRAQHVDDLRDHVSHLRPDAVSRDEGHHVRAAIARQWHICHDGPALQHDQCRISNAATNRIAYWIGITGNVCGSSSSRQLGKAISSCVPLSKQLTPHVAAASRSLRRLADPSRSRCAACLSMLPAQVCSRGQTSPL
jgi:hypothetical protein